MGQGSLSKHDDAESCIAFHADVESLAHPGSRSVLSEPISCMTPEELWELFAKDLRRREPRPPVRSYSSREREGGGILVIKVLDKGDKMPSTNYTTWNLDPAACKATASDHGTDRTLSKVVKTMHIQAHCDPLRLELWASESEGCSDEKWPLQVAMQALLKDMLKSSATCTVDVPSPSGERTCLLSDAIRDTALSPNEFWESLKGRLVKSASKVLPSGCVTEEYPQHGIWQLESGVDWSPSRPPSTSWMKHSFDDGAYELHSHCHGRDATLKEESLQVVLHVKVHWRPYRLEMWATSPPRRFAGEAEKAFAVELFGPIAQKAEERRMRRQKGEDERALLNAAREEISNSQNELRKELQALCAEVQELSRVKAGVVAA